MICNAGESADLQLVASSSWQKDFALVMPFRTRARS